MALPFIKGLDAQLTTMEAKKKQAEQLRVNIERFVDAVMVMDDPSTTQHKYTLAELLNESFSMDMLELLFKRMTSKLRSILFSRAKTLELIKIALDPQQPHHTRTIATSFLVIGNAGSSLISCNGNEHPCQMFWDAIFNALHAEASGIRHQQESETHKRERRASVTELEQMIQVEVRGIEADGAKSLQNSFLEAETQSEQSMTSARSDCTSSPSSARSSVAEDAAAMIEEIPMSPVSLASAVTSALSEDDASSPAKDNDPAFPLTQPVEETVLLNVFSAESANFSSQILCYFAVRAQRGGCILQYLAQHTATVDLLLANVGHDDTRTFLLHLIYSDHTEPAIEALFATRMIEKLIQKLLTFAPPRNVYERDAIENTFLLLREIMHAPYLTSRGVAISAKTIPVDKVTGQDEYVSICGASREMANSSLRKYTSRKVRRLVHLFMQQNQQSLDLLFAQMVKELTFWSSPVGSSRLERRPSVVASLASLALLSEGHPRPACTTMLTHLFELTETVDFTEENGKHGNGKTITSVGIDCLNFMCSTHLVRSGQLLLKRKLKNELQKCQLSVNCMMGLRITSLREEQNSNAYGDGFVHNQKGNQTTITLDEIESVDVSDWHEHGFILNVRKRGNSRHSSSIGFDGPLHPSHHYDEVVKTVEYFAASSEEEKNEWITLLRAAISGDLSELEIFCSDDWRSNIREYKQLRECLISCMEKKGHELMVFLKQIVVEQSRKASGYHLWTLAKLLYAVVANESKRLDQMFVSARLIDVLMRCYEKYPMWNLLLGEITKILLFYIGDFKSKRSRRCPVIERLFTSGPDGTFLPLLKRTFLDDMTSEVPKKNRLAGTDALSNLKLLVEAVRLCYRDPKTRSQQRIQSILKNDPEWQTLLEALDQQDAREPRKSITSVNSSIPSPVTNDSTVSTPKATTTAPSQPAFQEDIINQITRPCYSSSYGFGSSFLLGDGCAFGYLFKERNHGEHWQKALVVYEYVSYKLWYFYPSEADETHRITWKWVVPVSVRARYTHGQDANHTSVGHHGLYITCYDHQSGANHHHSGTPTREIHFSVTKLEDRDLWKEVLSNAASTIRQLAQEYTTMSLKLKKPDRKTVTHCQLCQVQFKLFRRPHACHRCGKWLCGKCTQNRKAIPEVGLMTPVRHCEACFEASGGAEADIEPVQLFRHSSGSMGSITGEPFIHGADSPLRQSLSNVELYELAHGMTSPRTLMRMSRHDSIDSPTGNSYQIDEVDGVVGRKQFFGDDMDDGALPSPLPIHHHSRPHHGATEEDMRG